MRHNRLVRILCFVMLAGASWGAAAQSSSDGRFFQGWFAQAADRPNGRGDNHGGTRPGSSRGQQQEVRPQGDLRGDIYNHLREQRQPPPPPPPPPDSRQRNRGDRGR